MKVAVLLFSLLLTRIAAAQPAYCIDPSQSWSRTYANDGISSITYYLDTRILSTAYLSGTSHLLNAVPLSVAQRFQTIGYGVSPDAIWAQVRYNFMEILQAQDHCPLMAQNGLFLLSNPARDTPN